MGESKCCGNGWTELTPDRVKELNLIEPYRIVIARLKDDGSVISTTRAGHNYYSLEEVVAETCLRFYFFILPELKQMKTKNKSEKLK